MNLDSYLTPNTKIYLRWLIGRNVTAKTTKLYNETRRKFSQHLSEERFLRIQNVLTMKAKINKNGLHEN